MKSFIKRNSVINFWLAFFLLFAQAAVLGDLGPCVAERGLRISAPLGRILGGAPEERRGNRDHGEQNREHRCGCGAVALRPAHGAGNRSRRTRLNRSVLEDRVQVVGERRHRRVTVVG